MLGRLCIRTGQTDVPPPRSHILQGLLGALLLAQGEPLRTERLTRLVWADRAELTSRESVHVGISRLRKWLTRLGDGAPSIDYADGYRLAVPGCGLDLSRFRELAGQARTIDEPGPRCALLVAALELRRGPVLAGMRQLDRADILLRSVEQDVREAVMDLAATAPHAEGTEPAIAAVGALAGDLPFDEPLHAALIDLLAAGGQPAEALNAYRRLSERLADELGVEPSREVQEAYLRVLAHERPFTPVPAPG
ncbi:AfsR/SARP family transcriptional regulator, partial [Actinomadura darangshiensis]|uniref:AfsR/SARP family transcriptional regulator n=1 Tax=Actinomadura darangshiensis TaxID=705336 RepID=UPI001A9ECDDF